MDANFSLKGRHRAIRSVCAVCGQIFHQSRENSFPIFIYYRLSGRCFSGLSALLLSSSQIKNNILPVIAKMTGRAISFLARLGELSNQASENFFALWYGARRHCFCGLICSIAQDSAGRRHFAYLLSNCSPEFCFSQPVCALGPASNFSCLDCKIASVLRRLQPVSSTITLASPQEAK